MSDKEIQRNLRRRLGIIRHAEEILLNEDRKQTTAITFNITGNYTGSSYELTYNNPPDLLFVWKKL